MAAITAPIPFQLAGRFGPVAGRESVAQSAHYSLTSQQSSLFGISVSHQGENATAQDRLPFFLRAENEEASERSPKRPNARRAVGHKHGPLVSMSKRQLLVGGVTGIVMATCPLCRVEDAAADEWSYGSLSGPPEWNSICAAGTKQSPIDIPISTVDLLDKSPVGGIHFGYKRASPSFLNTGHGTMQVDFPDGTNYIQVGDRKLTLLQYHFHAPSEHSFNGRRAAMEAHLVHRDDNGQLAVVGVMLESASFVPRNLCLQAALDFAPQERGATSGTPVECLTDPTDTTEEVAKESKEPPLCYALEISPSSLLPKPDKEDGRRAYIHYAGSLTTPPCSEGVDWFMLTSPVKVPGEQVLEFMTYVGDGQTLAMNSRPVQDLGERTIYFGP